MLQADPTTPHPPQELKAKEQIAQLKLEISNLTKLLEQGAAVGLAEVRGGGSIGVACNALHSHSYSAS